MSQHVTSPGRPPVILAGMHRSGTTLLARLLDQLGLFQGWKLAANHEASFFNKLNSWLFSSAGGRWDVPDPMDYLLADGPGREMAVAYLRARMSAPPALEFLGPRRYLAQRSLFAFDEPWGWKDPRTTVTLPIWLELFPEARVIHIVRHGIDVAESLHRRQVDGREIGRHNFERHRRLLRFMPKRGWFGTSPRVADRRQAFALWEEYMAWGAKAITGLGERLLELRYETILAEPEVQMGRILDFCGLDPAPRELAAALARIRPDRAFSFRRDPELVTLWRDLRNHEAMVRHGYDVFPDEAVFPNKAVFPNEAAFPGDQRKKPGETEG